MAKRKQPGGRVGSGPRARPATKAPTTRPKPPSQAREMASVTSLLPLIEAAVTAGVRAAFAAAGEMSGSPQTPRTAAPAPAMTPPVIAAAAPTPAGPSDVSSPAPGPLPTRVTPAVTTRAAAATFALSAPQDAATRPAHRLNELTEDTRPITRSMDPRLQMAVARARTGARRPATSSSGADELPVVAKVTDPQQWEALSEARSPALIGRTDDGNTIVTARLPLSRIEAVREQPFVVSIKAPRPVLPALANSTQETGARADLLPQGVDPAGGNGVVVGIVDFGCDFAHHSFRNPADGRTRIEAIWQQGAQGFADGPFGYGRLMLAAQIDAALATPDPYATLGYGPDPDTPEEVGAHGTHVMDIAAGSGVAAGGFAPAVPPGYAPRASIIFVDLAASDIPWGGADAVGKNFGDSVQLLEAIRFIFDRAGNRPCVVNLSLGTNGGPHDGTTLVEQGIDALIRERDNRAVVIAASNSRADGIHAAGTVPADGAPADLAWELHADNEPAEAEIWLPAEARVAIELIAPDGTALPAVEPGDNQTYKSGNTVVVHIANRLNEPSNGDNNIGVFIAGVFPAGQWTLRLHSRAGGGGGGGGGNPVPYHAWIERYDSAQSSFAAQQRDASHTLGSISCGRETIVVGSYDGKKPALPLSYFSSEGPTRDGRQKPDIAAPGHGVVAAWSRTGTGVISKSGTSMAAPAVSGLIALIYAEAARRGAILTAQRLRQILTQAARRNPPPGANWDPRYGFGRLSGAAVGDV